MKIEKGECKLEKLSSLNYAVSFTKVPSEWFDNKKGKGNAESNYYTSTYQKMGYKCFNLVCQLYKFRLYRQKTQHVFVTSIELLRNEMQTVSLNDDFTTSYSRKPSIKDVYEYLKTLVSLKIIKVTNIKDDKLRSLVDKKGNIQNEKPLIIEMTHNLDIRSKRERTDDKNKSFVQSNDTNDAEEVEKYIYVPLDVFEMMERVGLSEKYYPLYCLLKKWSNKEGCCYMSYEAMGKALGLNKKTVANMINEMNEDGIVATHDIGTDAKGHTIHHHYVLDASDDIKVKTFLTRHRKVLRGKRLDRRMMRNGATQQQVDDYFKE